MQAVEMGVSIGRRYIHDPTNILYYKEFEKIYDPLHTVSIATCKGELGDCSRKH